MVRANPGVYLALLGLTLTAGGWQALASDPLPAANPAAAPADKPSGGLDPAVVAVIGEASNGRASANFG
jgi:hypothetical protein